MWLILSDVPRVARDTQALLPYKSIYLLLIRLQAEEKEGERGAWEISYYRFTPADFQDGGGGGGGWGARGN